jgi:hypothetical protein
MAPLDLCWSLRLPLCLLRLKAEAVPVTGREPRQQSWLWAPLRSLTHVKSRRCVSALSFTSRKGVPRRCDPDRPAAVLTCQGRASRCGSGRHATPATPCGIADAKPSGSAFMGGMKTGAGCGRNARFARRPDEGFPGRFAKTPVPDRQRTGWLSSPRRLVRDDEGAGGPIAGQAGPVARA